MWTASVSPTWTRSSRSASQGRHVASRGPLPIPPSEQGQPVIFQAGGGSYGLELAGRYADGVYANPYTIEDSQEQRQALRDAAERAGRDPDEVKIFAGFMPAIAASRRAALTGGGSWTNPWTCANASATSAP
ncbi:hypothetical protein STENM36S_03882 [Streptomyces tendae]